MQKVRGSSPRRSTTTTRDMGPRRPAGVVDSSLSAGGDWPVCTTPYNPGMKQIGPRDAASPHHRSRLPGRRTSLRALALI